MPTVDTRDVQDAVDFPVVPPGRYKAEVADCTEKYTQGDGKTYFNFRWKIIEGELEGASVFDKLFFTGKTEASTKQLLSRVKMYRKHLGLPFEGDAQSVEPQDFVGKQGIITVINEDYNGSPQSKLSFGGVDYIDGELPKGNPPSQAGDGSKISDDPNDEVPF